MLDDLMQYLPALATLMAAIATFLAWRTSRLQLKSSYMAQVYAFQRLIVQNADEEEYLKLRLIDENLVRKFRTSSDELKQLELFLLSVWAGHYAYGRYLKLRRWYALRRVSSYDELLKLIHKKKLYIPEYELAGKVIRSYNFMLKWPLIRRLWSSGPDGFTAAIVQATIESFLGSNKLLHSKLSDDLREIDPHIRIEGTM